MSGPGFGGNIVTAYHSNNHEIVRRLLQVSVIDVNYKIGDLKWNAMHFAARFGYKCCEELAMCPEVDWNSINFYSETPLLNA